MKLSSNEYYEKITICLSVCYAHTIQCMLAVRQGFSRSGSERKLYQKV